MFGGTMGYRTLALIASVFAVSCSSGPKSAYLSTPQGSSATVSVSVGTGQLSSMELHGLRVQPATCQGVAEMRPEYTLLDESSLIRFLQARGFEVRRTRARSDLVYVDLMNAGGDGPLRLRVAVLPSAQAAGRELHEAILEHGPGSWGVHRSNLAVLAPIGTPEQLVAFATKTQLACWGVLTLAGRDDSFVVPGGYTEL